MDLSQFKASSSKVKTKTVKKGSNPVIRGLLSFKDWVYPPITTLRQQRINHYKDLAIFAGAILAIGYFEDKIKAFL